MRKLKEDLNYAKIEPQSPAAQQAKALNLSYVGFGRYVDPQTGQVTHIVQNDKLVPFNRAVRSNTFKNESSDNYGDFNMAMMPDIQELHKTLTKAYNPARFDDQELDAIYHFSSGGYFEINNRLATLPSDVPAKMIEKMTTDDTMPDLIASLDSATRKIRVPKDFHTYTNLSADVDLSSIQPGSSFRFKGFRNTSCNLSTVLSQASQSTSAAGRTQVVMLQINVKKNSRGLYAADFTANVDDCEFILPRGAMIEVVGGPSQLVGSDAMTSNMNLEVMYYDCEVKS